VLLIFDWDGTIADSRAHIVEAMQRAIDELGWPARSDAQCAELIGLGLHEVAATLFPALGESAWADFAAVYSGHFLDLDRRPDTSCLFPAVATTLAELQRRGYALAVATGKSRRGLDRVLRASRLAPYFVASRAADETASKPSPLMLEELLQETGYSVDEAVMIGDTHYDMAMAEAIGMTRIAVSYGVHSVAQLSEHKPLCIVDHFEQLLDCPPLR